MLTESQRDAASIHYSENQLVIAGPGTGKTTTGVALMYSFDAQLDDHHPRSVLFLSFSRAAIQAAFNSVKDELADLDLYVDHQTLDSLATAQLAELGFLDESNLDFDRRILQATTLLKTHGEELLEDVCHVIVDESQDILGIRQSYLIELFAHLPEDCGISVFGDPLQSIYQFLNEHKNKPKSAPIQKNSLVEWEIFVEKAFNKRIYSTKILTDQFRAKRLKPKLLFRELESLRLSKSAIEISNRLNTIVSDLESLSVQMLKTYLPNWTGSTILLTRTNADAIQLFEILIANEIPVDIALRNEFKPKLPSWLAAWALISDSDKFKAKDLFQYLSDDAESLEQAQNLGVDFTFDEEVYWDEIRQNSQFYRPRNGSQSKEGTVVISTVHQAKGLEFDNVLVHNPGQYLTDPIVNSSSSEIEVLFVALSRGMRIVNAFDMALEKVVSKENTLFRSHPNPRYRPRSICITPKDIRSAYKVGDASTQYRLVDFSTGDQLSFKVIPSSFEVPIYRCYLDGTPVAVTTEDFGRRLMKNTQPKKGLWPKLSPVPIVRLQSSFSKDVTLKAPFLIPMPLGFSDISYK